jgi:hypothetical protein
MARLERGLARRALRRPIATPVEPATSAVEQCGDDRLRSAIENLQKMAARAG